MDKTTQDASTWLCELDNTVHKIKSVSPKNFHTAAEVATFSPVAIPYWRSMAVSFCTDAAGEVIPASFGPLVNGGAFQYARKGDFRITGDLITATDISTSNTTGFNSTSTDLSVVTKQLSNFGVYAFKVDGFTNEQNNGLFFLSAAATTNNIPVINKDTLITETAGNTITIQPMLSLYNTGRYLYGPFPVTSDDLAFVSNMPGYATTLWTPNTVNVPNNNDTSFHENFIVAPHLSFPKHEIRDYMKVGFPFTHGTTINGATLTPDTHTFNGFGKSVACSGDGTRVVVGAPNQDQGALSDAGAVFVFEPEVEGSSNYILKETLLPFTPQANAQFGSVVVMSKTGEVVIVSEPFFDSPTANVGRVHAFIYDGSEWVRTTVYTDTNANASVGADPYSIAIDATGYFLFIGGTQNQGYTRVYQRAGLSFSYVNQLRWSGTFTEHGNAIACSGDGTELFIYFKVSGGTGGEQYGLFKRVTTVNGWINYSFATDNIDNPISSTTNFGFGDSISASEDLSVILMGIPLNDLNNTNEGAVINARISGGTLVEYTALLPCPTTAGTGTAERRFGTCVKVSPDATKMFVGARGDTTDDQETSFIYEISLDADSFLYTLYATPHVVQTSGGTDTEFKDSKISDVIDCSDDGNTIVFAEPDVTGGGILWILKR